MSQSSDASSDDSEPRESLVAGRAKRTNAGNRLSHLLQHLDDDDIKADLLAEDEDDQQDYSASDAEGDIGMGSSSEEEDDAAANDALSGEKEIKRQERKESSKKRKARELVRIQPMSKKPRTGLHAPVALTGDTRRAPKAHKNVLERVSAFQSDTGPVRQSARSQTVANAKVTQAKLKDHYKRAVKAQELMKIAAEKKAADARPALTQADRMARALEIEEENSLSLNHWEFHEKERQRIQREKLEAMRQRKIQGPFIRYWSGPVMWKWRQGPDGPVHKTMSYRIPPAIQPKIEVIEEAPTVEPTKAVVPVSEGRAELPDAGHIEVSTSGAQSVKHEQDGDHKMHVTEAYQDMALERQQAHSGAKVDEAGQSEISILEGIQFYAQADQVSPSTREVSHATQTQDQPEGTATFVPLPSMPPYIHFDPNSTSQTPIESDAVAALPLHTAKATRNLIMLESFESLESLPQPKSRRATNTQITPTPFSNAVTYILLPDSHPDLSSEERRYLTARMKQPPKSRDSLIGSGQQSSTASSARSSRTKTDQQDTSLLPAPPSRPTCAITGKTARFRDPRTGLHYRDRMAYVAIRRVLTGGSQWSTLLGAWSGIVGSGPMGRVALGVPKEFWSGKEMTIQVASGSSETPVEGQS